MATENRQIKIRRDTAANWTSNNPILAQGEFGLDTTNKLVKLGDGSTAWNSLDYYFGDGLVINTSGDVSIGNSSQKAQLHVGDAVSGSVAGYSVPGWIMAVGDTPGLAIVDNDGVVDNKWWDFIGSSSGTFAARALNDLGTVITNWLVVGRTGTTIDTISFPSGDVSIGNSSQKAQLHVGDAVSSGVAGYTVPGWIMAVGDTPGLAIVENDAAANSRWWDFVGSSSGFLAGRVLSDNGSTTVNWLVVGRTGTVVDSVTFSATAIKATLAGSTGGSDVRFNTGTNEIFYDTSAKKYKKNIKKDPDTSWLYDIEVKTYDRKDDSRKGEIGIIADDLEKIAPNYVCYNAEKEIESYSKSDLVPILINEIQKLRKDIDELKKRYK